MSVVLYKVMSVESANKSAVQYKVLSIERADFLPLCFAASLAAAAASSQGQTDTMQTELQKEQIWLGTVKRGGGVVVVVVVVQCLNCAVPIFI